MRMLLPGAKHVCMPKKGTSITAFVFGSRHRIDRPDVAGPKTATGSNRFAKLKEQLTRNIMITPVSQGGYGKTEDELSTRLSRQSARTNSA